jgi:hypothetical protein
MRKPSVLLSTLAMFGAAAILAACSSSDSSGSNPNLAVAMAGDAESYTGFAFPAASENDPAFVDGWEVRFDRILVTVDRVVLTDNPDVSPTDQSQTGPVVAQGNGPWVIDVTRPGSATTDVHTGAIRPLHEGEGTLEHDGSPNAQILTRLGGLDGNKSFDTSVRYGFGFDFLAATPSAAQPNLDDAGKADYADMVQKGISVLYVGTATFKGTDCKASDSALPEKDRFDFARLPKSVKFRFGFKTPTTYANCQNSSLKGKAFEGEEAQRGVQLASSGSTRAQVTVHVDHPFWSTVDHDAAELYFDQMAAAATADGTLTLDDLAAVDFTTFKDKQGKALPWRSCVASKPVKTGTRKFDAGSVAVDPMAAPGAALRNYADYVSYQQSTQGHLNADGLCAVKRNFAAPR